jgi:hypothetical protein
MPLVACRLREYHLASFVCGAFCIISVARGTEFQMQSTFGIMSLERSEYTCFVFPPRNCLCPPMPIEVPQTPRLTPLSFSHLCARYLQAQFKFKLNARSSRSRFPFTGTSAAPPLLLPDTIVLELDRIARHLADAFLNPS